MVGYNEFYNDLTEEVYSSLTIMIAEMVNIH